MRRREEQRRKLHEALINMLYPPPSPPPAPYPPSMVEERNEDQLANALPLPDEIPEELDEEKSWGTSSEEGGDGKLTRAQRKRLRKRKLKEDAARRGKMIGPLLMVTGEDDEPEGVRRNDSQNYNLRTETEEAGGAVGSCSGKNKMKQRRRGRKLSKTMPECANTEKLNGDDGGGGPSAQINTLSDLSTGGKPEQLDDECKKLQPQPEHETVDGCVLQCQTSPVSISLEKNEGNQMPVDE